MELLVIYFFESIEVFREFIFISFHRRQIFIKSLEIAPESFRQYWLENRESSADFRIDLIDRYDIAASISLGVIDDILDDAHSLDLRLDLELWMVDGHGDLGHISVIESLECLQE